MAELRDGSMAQFGSAVGALIWGAGWFLRRYGVVLQ